MREQPVEAKDALRRRLIAERREVAVETRCDWSRAICRRVCDSVAFRNATDVVAYVPMGAEVDPEDAAAAALRAGCGLYSPDPDGGFEFRRTGILGTLPGRGDDVLTRNDPRVVFLVPGVGFDEAGGRLGRGGGWYDRALARFDRATRWGLGFDLQLVRRLPVDPWGISMDAVITERRRIETTQSLVLPEGNA